jgi:hypothetical protein
MAEELTFAQKRLWATKLADGMLKVWREEGRTCILMSSLPDGRCTISAYETEAEALADKEKADIQLGQGHSIIRPLDAEPRILADRKASSVIMRQEDAPEAADELPEGAILCAVIFDKHRKPKRTLVNTLEKEAWLQAGEMNCPTMVLYGLQFNHISVTKRMPSTLFVEFRFAVSYGEPSERIKEQLVRQAHVELQAAFLEASGGRAYGAGQA